MDDYKRNVGLRISNIRKEKGYSLEEFGRLIDNASKGLVSNWEKGYNLPNKKRIKLICDLAGITTYDLLYGSMEGFLKKHLDELLPEDKNYLAEKILLSDFFKFSRELERMGVSMKDLEQIKLEISSRIPKWEENILRTANTKIANLRNNIKLRDNVLKIISNDEEKQKFHNTDVVSYIFDNLERLSAQEKIKYIGDLDEINIIINHIRSESTVLTETNAYVINDIWLDISFNSLNFEDGSHSIERVSYRRKHNSIPESAESFDLLVQIDRPYNPCDFINEGDCLLLTYYPNFSKDMLNNYFLESRIALYENDQLFIGFIDKDLVFHTQSQGDKLMINLLDRKFFSRIFPLHNVFY